MVTFSISEEILYPGNDQRCVDGKDVFRHYEIFLRTTCKIQERGDILPLVISRIISISEAELANFDILSHCQAQMARDLERKLRDDFSLGLTRLIITQ